MIETVVMAEEGARRRIGYDIHAGIAQLVVSAKQHLDTARAIGGREPDRPDCELGRGSATKYLEIWGRVDNAPNARYATAGALNWNAFGDPIGIQRFVAPGAPIGGWGGITLRF